MKAVHIHNYGGRDVLHYDDDAVKPQPGPGEVLIRVHATSVNPFDCWVHNGWVAQMFNYTFPLIPGSDVSGIVEEVGPGVTDAAVGDFVPYVVATRNASDAPVRDVVVTDVLPPNMRYQRGSARLESGAPLMPEQGNVLTAGLPPGEHEYMLYLPLYNGVSMWISFSSARSFEKLIAACDESEAIFFA